MTWLSKYEQPLLSVLRIVVGLLFLEHGTQKILGFPAMPEAMVHAIPPGAMPILTAAGGLELVLGTLIVLGMGWNLGFVGASALVLETHRPQERNKVQALNDFLVFGMMAVGSFSSGELLANYGWSAVNMVVYPPVALGLIVLALTSFANRRRARLQEVDEFPEPSI